MNTYEERRDHLLVIMRRQTDQWLREDALRDFKEEQKKLRRKERIGDIEEHYHSEVKKQKKRTDQQGNLFS